MPKTTDWFEVSRSGLRQLMEGKAKSFVVRELVQNCWDEPGVTHVEIELEHESHGIAKLIVRDDAPEGFHDLSHAYTLFADSRKRKDPTKRGRFNLGEKQVLALCRDAKIATTTGTILFHADGTRTKSAAHTTAGSIFHASIRMNKLEIDECVLALRAFLPPEGITTFVNGSSIVPREPVSSVEAFLTTEYTDNEGGWRRSRRRTKIDVVEILEGEVPMLYEMGIPVVELEGGDKYHYNVNQRVPLNQDRDNVSPAYLRDLRGEVINVVADKLTKEEANESWVREATSTDRVNEAAFKTVVKKQFGDKVTSFSVHDREANFRAVSKGYTVLAGGSMSKGQWANARRFEAVSSSSKVCPTSNPEFSAGGTDIRVPIEDYTPAMNKVVDFAEWLGTELIGGVLVKIVKSTQNFGAWYGGRELSLNYRRLGRQWFESFPENRSEVVELVIHELAHEVEGNHLSSRYHQECCRLGAKAAELALRAPKLFRG